MSNRFLDRMRSRGDHRETMRRETPVTIAIVIPTVGRVEQVRTLLQSISIQTLPPDEVIVVDQNRDDILGDLLAATTLPLTRIHLDEPNASAARNAGFLASKASHVLFLDDDEILDPDFLSRIADTYWRFPFVGCLWPVLHHGADRDRAVKGWHRISTGETIPGTSLFSVSRTGSGGVSFERDVFRRSGGYDELMFRYARVSEDWDLSVRMRRRGLTMWCDDALFLRHQPAQSGGCETRSLPVSEVRQRVARAVTFTLRASNGGSFGLRLRDMIPIFRYVFLSSFGRPDAYRDLLRHPLATLTMLRQAARESRALLEQHRAAYESPSAIDHLSRKRDLEIVPSAFSA